MKKQKGVSLIALIITIIVIIILAAIVMMSGGNTANKAGLARFDSDFDTYRTQVALDSLNLRQTLGARGVNANDPQIYFMTANGITKVEGEKAVEGYMMPVGYQIPDLIYEILGLPKYSGDASGTADVAVVAYPINDAEIEGYSKKVSFYGDSNGLENHFVTSSGVVFTLPGFEVRQDDGTIEYHITPDLYYVIPGTSKLNARVSSKSGDSNINGDEVNASNPILITGEEPTAPYGLDQNGKKAENDAANYQGFELRKAAGAGA